MKITLITATFNSEQSIRSCLESIKSQHFNDIEHLIIDGASTDTTLNIVEEFGFSKVYSEKDEGIYDALNKGLKLASGDVIGFLHADDIFNNELSLEKVSQGFDNDEYDAVYGDLLYVNKNGGILRNWKSGEYEDGIYLKGWMPPHPTLYLRRSWYDLLGHFNTALKISADYEFMLRLMKSGARFKYIPEPLVKMTIGGASNGSLKNILRKSREDYMAMKINKLPLPSLVLARKNIRKLPQFFQRS